MGPVQVHLLDREPNSSATNIASIERSEESSSVPIETPPNADQNVGDALDSLIKETLTDTDASRLSPAKKVRPESVQNEDQQEQPVSIVELTSSISYIISVQITNKSCHRFAIESHIFHVFS